MSASDSDSDLIFYKYYYYDEDTTYDEDTNEDKTSNKNEEPITHFQNQIIEAEEDDDTAMDIDTAEIIYDPKLTYTNVELLEAFLKRLE